jgi:hypothetical protein
MKLYIVYRRVLRGAYGRAFLALGLTFTALLVTVDGASSATKMTTPAQVISSTARSVVFRVDLEPWTVTPSPEIEGADRLSLPGFVSRGAEGEPARPARKFLVGLPTEGSWTVSGRVLGTSPLGRMRLEPRPFRDAERGGDLGLVPVERYEIRDAVYNAYRSGPVVSGGDPVWIRRQRVLPVWVEPLTYDPASGEAVLATSIEITVSFAGGDEGRPGARDLRGSGESPEWQDMFSRLLVNSGQAREWRRPVFIRSQAPGSAEMTVQTGPLAKLSVSETGIHKVAAEIVIGAGFPAGQDVGALHLFKRGYDDDALTGTVTDVAFVVDEHSGGTQGVFDGQDALIFYALKPADDADLKDPHQNLSDQNVYWLGTTSGTAMTDRVLTPGVLSPDTATAWFPVSRRMMIDNMFREETPPGIRDYYYFNEPTATVVDFPFEMGAARPGSSVILDAEIHGAVNGEIRYLDTKLVNSGGTRTLDLNVASAYKSILNYQNTGSASVYDVGTNTFRFARSVSETNRFVNVHLNWIRISYEALYRARGNELHFNTASLSGDTSLAVTGLNDTDLWLFDVTDPVSPVNCVLGAPLFTDVGGSYALTFRDAISTRKEYILVPQSRMIEVQAGDVELDAPSRIIGDPAENGVEVLVVSHGDFATEMQDWARYRRAQGRSVLLVDVEDVYDEFNGGVKGTQAIDRFVRHFFETGNAGYVVLVGDASEDHKTVYENSGPDFVPSHARTEHVGGEFNEDEVVTLDKKYVKLPDPGGTVDEYPDLIIGRLPFGSVIELNNTLYKTYLFEAPKATDFWRRRMIVVADDAYKGSTTLYRYYASEEDFENGQELTARVMEAANPGTFDVVRFYLSDYTDALHPNHEPVSLTSTQCYVRQFVTPVLLSELEQGATLVTFQAHMNRLQVGHEYLFTTQGSATTCSQYGSKDHYRCNNRNKPFIIFGMGCHFSDYAIHKELFRKPPINPNGDSFAEQLLFQNNEGAAATYGSSGFEYLGEVNRHMKTFSDIMFYNAPYDSMISQTQGKWVFGQLMFLTETAVLDRYYVQQWESIDRYHILGDPLLRIDAGPPLMDVTVNGQPFSSGDNFSTGVDTIHVVANVTDENVIEKFELIIDENGSETDISHTLDITPVGDETIPRSRTYQVSFRHAVQFNAYELKLRALQAADTTAGQYHMEAEFVIVVPSSFSVSVNGRPVGDGDQVPSKGDYRMELRFPLYIPSSEIGVKIDGEDVTGLSFMHPSPEDSTTWIVQFSRTLADGRHDLEVSAGTDGQWSMTLVVSSTVGLRNVFNYPNPFTEATQFVYDTDVEIESGTIDVFTVSGKKIVRLDIPRHASMPGQNAVTWDGRDAAGDNIANGVYLYVIRVKQRGQESLIRGKMAHIR